MAQSGQPTSRRSINMMRQRNSFWLGLRLGSAGFLAA